MNYTGIKYDAGLNIVEVAKRVRKAIKDNHPDIKASVTTKRFSGGQSLDVRITGCPFPIVNPSRHEAERTRIVHEYEDPRFTEPASKLLKDLESLVNQWNRDLSDTMTDYFNVKFYEHVFFDWEIEEAERAQLDALLDAGFVNMKEA